MSEETREKLKFLFTNAISPTPQTRIIISRYWFFGVMLLMFGLLLILNS